jgi:hypothetical protein
MNSLLSFLILVGEDLLEVVEDSRVKGNIKRRTEFYLS